MKKVVLVVLSVLLIGCSSATPEDQQSVLTPESSTQAEVIEPTPSEEVKTEPEGQVGHIGDTLTTTDGLEITLDGVFIGKDLYKTIDEASRSEKETYYYESQSGNFVFAFFTIHNTSNSPLYVNISAMKFTVNNKEFAVNVPARIHPVAFTPTFNGTKYGGHSGGGTIQTEATANIYAYADMTESTSNDPELMFSITDGNVSFYLNK